MPLELPEQAPIPALEERRPSGSAYAPRVGLEQAQPPQAPIPQADFVVEVVGDLPIEAKVQDVTLLLGRRQITASRYRTYPPTILELITLVKRNPQKPRGRDWTSVRALTIRYDQVTWLVSVEYCVEYCEHDRSTGAFHPKRKMVTYSAPEDAVAAKVDKKLASLAKYADR